MHCWVKKHYLKINVQLQKASQKASIKFARVTNVQANSFPATTDPIKVLFHSRFDSRSPA